MIPKPLDQIEALDVDALLSEQIPEGRTIEYKRDLPGSTDSDKKEFLADVSSFANTSGGDLVFGIDEAAGIPTAIVGLSPPDLDLEQRRLDSMILSGIEPRIGYSIKSIAASNGQRVVVVRIDQSWNAPHRVVFKQHDRFYARSSAGKYSLDTMELRQAFMRSANISQAISNFRDERVVEIDSGRTPIALGGRARMVLHLIPLEAFATRQRIDIDILSANAAKLKPMSTSSWSNRITMQGLLTHTSADGRAITYTHIFRNGIIESVDAFILRDNQNGKFILPSIAFEQRLLQAGKEYLEVLRAIGISPPIYCFVTLIGVSGLEISLSNSVWGISEPVTLKDHILALPETVLQSFDDGPTKMLRESFDMIWNAFGYERSANFDSAGNWAPT